MPGDRPGDRMEIHGDRDTVLPGERPPGLGLVRVGVGARAHWAAGQHRLHPFGPLVVRRLKRSGAARLWVGVGVGLGSGYG